MDMTPKVHSKTPFQKLAQGHIKNIILPTLPLLKTQLVFFSLKDEYLELLSNNMLLDGE
jgi:hypothetical protein